MGGWLKKYEYSKNIPQGYKFDLPTEAQWEYACRAGTTTSLNSSKNISSETGSCYNLDEVGWYDKNSESEVNGIKLLYFLCYPIAHLASF